MPNPLAGRYDQLAVGLLLGLAATLACLAVWRQQRHRPGAGTPVAGLALAVAGAVGLRLTGAPAAAALGWPALAVSTALAGAALADFDRRWRGHGLVPGLLFLSAAGIYACVPDVEAALVVLGVVAPMTLLGWPLFPIPRRATAPSRPPFALGVAGSLATATLLVWTVAVGGAARPGAVVGGLACLGLLVVEPAVRRLDPRHRGPLDALDRRRVLAGVALAAQAVLVAVASRVVGRVEHAGTALLRAGLELAVALALAGLVALLGAGQQRVRR